MHLPWYEMLDAYGFEAIMALVLLTLCIGLGMGAVAVSRKVVRGLSGKVPVPADPSRALLGDVKLH